MQSDFSCGQYKYIYDPLVKKGNTLRKVRKNKAQWTVLIWSNFPSWFFTGVLPVLWITHCIVLKETDDVLAVPFMFFYRFFSYSQLFLPLVGRQPPPSFLIDMQAAVRFIYADCHTDRCDSQVTYFSDICQIAETLLYMVKNHLL